MGRIGLSGLLLIYASAWLLLWSIVALSEREW
jgi:hypothetical protein